jgi:hypothetical protein
MSNGCFDIIGIEPSGSTTKELVGSKITEI